MNDKKKIGFVSRLKSIRHAINGLKRMIQQEPNARIHVVATIAVIAEGLYKQINKTEWLAIVIAISLVWITESVNTCIELLSDFACDNKMLPAIKVIKDISAGAVLIAAITSASIGIIVFIF